MNETKDQEVYEDFKRYSKEQLITLVSLLKSDNDFSKLVGLIETKIELMEAAEI